jgi:hypothetical protein
MIKNSKKNIFLLINLYRMDYKQKYLKYKKKYLMLQNSIGGGLFDPNKKTFIIPDTNERILVDRYYKPTQKYSIHIETKNNFTIAHDTNKNLNIIVNLIKITAKNFNKVKDNDKKYMFIKENTGWGTKKIVSNTETYTKVKLEDSVIKLKNLQNKEITLKLTDFFALQPVMLTESFMPAQ